MPVNLANFAEVPLQGIARQLPASSCKPVKEFKMAGVAIDWQKYNLLTSRPVAIPVNLLAMGVMSTIEYIQGVYIDNTGNGVSVSVFFPDTGFSVSVGPNQTMFSPVYTNDVRAYICGETAFAIVTQTITQVYFTNSNVIPFSATKLPDPLPGDGPIEGTIDLTSVINSETVVVAGSTRPQFIYWSSIYLWAYNEQSSGATEVKFILVDQPSTDPLFSFKWNVNGYATGRGQCIFSQSGLGFLTLSANAIVLRQLNAPLLAGKLVFNITYTVRPA